jgi:integron integrase
VRHHGMRHPRTLGEREMREYLSHLATDRDVSASTQSQALAALLFLYTEVLRDPAPWIVDVVRARRPHRLPVVMTREEVRAVLEQMRGTQKLVALLLYGSGLRLMEALRLRVKDLDFGANQITVRAGKGDRDRMTMLPAAARDLLREHLRKVERLHVRDRAAGAGRTILPHALAKKYPGAAAELAWQWVFPARRIGFDAKTRWRYRHHLHETVVQRAMRDGDWKLVLPFGNPGPRPWAPGTQITAPSAKQPRLIRIDRDPYEKEDLAEKYPERVSAMMAELAAWAASVTRTPSR